MDLPPPDFEGKPLPKPTPPQEQRPEPAAPMPPSHPDDPPPLLGQKKYTPAEPTIDLDPDSILSFLKDALTYPWRNDGWMIVIPGGLIAAGATVSAFGGILGLITFVLGGCYFADYYFSVIQTTLTGRHHPPEWPSISDYVDDLLPGIQMAGVALFSLLPLLLLAVTGLVELDDRAMGFRELVGHAIYWMYFPMATLAVVWHGTLAAALPHRIIPSIAKCMPGYLLGVGALASGAALQQLLTVPLGVIPVVGSALPYLAYFYTLIVQARLTGTLYLRYQDRINW